MSMNTGVITYFETLREASLRLIDRLGLQAEPLPLEVIMRDLNPKLEDANNRAVFARIVKPRLGVFPEPQLGVGLNSVGMLVDRLTILFIREWCLLHKGEPKAEKALQLYEQQTCDIIHALAQSRPGSAALNSKITHLKGEARAKDWAEAFYGLLSTNILLWESQEILYIRDIAQLPAEELRSYIQWFAYGNIRRNEYIQFVEQFYWRSGEEAPGLSSAVGAGDGAR